jgi:hypothetical protein
MKCCVPATKVSQRFCSRARSAVPSETVKGKTCLRSQNLPARIFDVVAGFPEGFSCFRLGVAIRLE